MKMEAIQRVWHIPGHVAGITPLKWVGRNENVERERLEWDKTRVVKYETRLEKKQTRKGKTEENIRQTQWDYWEKVRK